MSKNLFIVWSIIYLVVMAILIIGFGAVKSWLDLFTGFVMGWTVYALLSIFRERKRNKRNLR